MLMKLAKLGNVSIEEMPTVKKIIVLHRFYQLLGMNGIITAIVCFLGILRVYQKLKITTMLLDDPVS